MNRTLSLTLAFIALAAPALAQQGNAVPQVEIIRWVVTNQGGTRIVYDRDAAIGSRGAVSSFIHFEGDRIAIRLEVTDPDWTAGMGMGGDNNEAVFLRYLAEGFESVYPPSAPPVAGASEYFQPRQGEGFRPGAGSLVLILNRNVVLPDFVGRNQARLRGNIDFDVAYQFEYCVANSATPESDAVIGCDTTLVRVIENPFVTPQNPPPFADAGADRTVATGATVTLDGSRTFDSFNVGFAPNAFDVFEADDLEFTWEFISGPEIVEPTQDDLNDPTATVTLGALGTYVYRLTVDDGVNDAPSTDTVSVTVVASFPPSNPPTAVIEGPASAVTVGQVITLSGMQSSDPDGDDLTFRWTQTNELGDPLTKEEFARAFQPLSGVDSAVSTWQAVAAGTYYFRLLVTDGDFLTSARFTIVVNAAATNGAVATTADLATDAGLDGLASPLGACGAGMLPLLAAPLVLLVTRRRSR